MIGSTKRLGALLTVVFLGLAGCEGLFGPPPPSRFRASLEEAVEGSYEGSGRFTDRSKDPHSGYAIFSITSRGEGDSEGQSFNLYRWGKERPSSGTHSIRLHGFSEPGAEAFYAFFTRNLEDGAEFQYEAYAAERGEVTITRSSKDRIEGTFRFRGFRYCALRRDGTGEGPCSVPDAPIEDAPTLEVTGSFSVAPLSDDDIEALPPLEVPAP